MLAADAGARRHLHPALRGDPPVPARARAGPGGRGERGADLRADPRARPSRPAGSRPTPARCGPRSCCARPRATRPRLRGAAARGGAGVLADGGDRAAHRRDVGDHRARGPADVHRRAAPDHLRPAHRRRPAGVRRSRGAVPLRLPHPAVVRRGAAGLRGAAHRAPRDAAAAARRRVHPPVGRLPGHRPRLGRLGRAGPEHRARLGGRVRRRRGRHHQPGRAHAQPTWSRAPTATW